MVGCYEGAYYFGKAAESDDEAWGNAMNTLRTIGGENCTSTVKTAADLDAVANAIQKAANDPKGKGIYIRFTTTDRVAKEDKGSVKKGDITGVWENWQGSKGLENYQAPTGGGFKDSSPAVNGEAAKPVSKPDTVVKKEEEVTEFRDDMDLDSLYKRAINEDDPADSLAAQKYLQELAEKEGMSDADFSAASWEDVRNFLKGDGGESSGSVGADEKEEPKKGDIVGFLPPDPKKKGKFLDKVECEVTFVDTKAETVTLKNNSTKKVYKDVSWESIVSID